jgi:hypothetical protein
VNYELSVMSYEFAALNLNKKHKNAIKMVGKKFITMEGVEFLNVQKHRHAGHRIS